MTDQNNAARRSSSFTLDTDIVVGDQVVHTAGTKVQVRRPNAGELRGVNISALISSCDYAEVERVAPRVTSPVLLKEHVAAMDPADFVQLGGEIVDFLLPTAVKLAASQGA
ncbi:phage tail assembly protein [uncultured Sphingomonas sp.]|uniref:phage tail assembly protein n=1 Tax=uncultured Sphingomonas sp. TaxID=158754 RepID=UPI0025F67EFC|nr:phage tail assembly protein [uncultured Sphingomonas sp.]